MISVLVVGCDRDISESKPEDDRQSVKAEVDLRDSFPEEFRFFMIGFPGASSTEIEINPEGAIAMTRMDGRFVTFSEERSISIEDWNLLVGECESLEISKWNTEYSPDESIMIFDGIHWEFQITASKFELHSKGENGGPDPTNPGEFVLHHKSKGNSGDMILGGALVDLWDRAELKENEAGKQDVEGSAR